jgi:hypothetical protein
VYERILVPLDGSDRTEPALLSAEEPAAKRDSQVILLCVSDPAGAKNNARNDNYLEQITEIDKHAPEKLLSNPVLKGEIQSAITINLSTRDIVEPSRAGCCQPDYHDLTTDTNRHRAGSPDQIPVVNSPATRLVLRYLDMR